MSTAGLINKYVWFVTTIYNRGPISRADIQRRFQTHFGLDCELDERAFHRYTDAVEERNKLLLMYNPKLEWARDETREFIKIISFVNAKFDTIFEECGIICREREQTTVCQIIPC